MISVCLIFKYGNFLKVVKHTSLPCRPLRGDFYEPCQEDLRVLKSKLKKVHPGFKDSIMEYWTISKCSFLGQTFVVDLVPNMFERT